MLKIIYYGFFNRQLLFKDYPYLASATKQYLYKGNRCAPSILLISCRESGHFEERKLNLD